MEVCFCLKGKLNIKMDNYSIESICRLCLSRSKPKDMLNLFNETTPDGLSFFGKTVKGFAKVSLEINEEFPSYMCKKCSVSLKEAIRFKFMCENNELRLKKFHEKCEELRGDSKGVESFQTLFNFYFPEKTSRKTANKAKDAHITQNVPETIKEIEIQILNPIKIEDKETSEKATEEKETASVTKLKKTTVKIVPKQIPSNGQCEPKTIPKNGQSEPKRIPRNAQSQPKPILRNGRKKPDLTCNICQKVLATKLSYRCHMQRHSGCKYICETCGKGFPILNALNTHKVARHGTGNYLKCNQCDYKAPCQFALTEHIRIHTGERPFTCDKCGLTFRRQCIWRKHLFNHTEKTLKCPQCPMMFRRTACLNEHMNNCHERLYMFSCVKCGCLYTKPRSVRKHLLEKHGVPRAQQGKIPKVMKDNRFFVPEK